jgi:peptidoglycan/LPS O-acetylase OafA/YrhL
MSETGKHHTPVYFADLDGLRFFAFLAVFLFHSFHTEDQGIVGSDIYQFVKKVLVTNGNLGVNFFFVLSGFLITYLLIAEKEQKGSISIGKFYLRRMFRIWPLYYLIVIFGFLIFPQIKLMFGEIPRETADYRYYLCFLNNFDFINKGLPDASMLGVLWSIAVEEQFYLVWPLLLFTLPQKKYPFVFLSVIAISIIFRSFNNNYNIYEYHTFSVMGDLAVGAMGAWLFYNNTAVATVVKELNKLEIIGLYLCVIFILIFRKELWDTPFAAFERLIVAIVFLGVLLEQIVAERSLFKLSNFPVVSYLGRISYGLYCYQFIGILIALKLPSLLGVEHSIYTVMIIEPLLGLLATIGIAYLSFNFFEKPFLRLKGRFS